MCNVISRNLNLYETDLLELFSPSNLKISLLNSVSSWAFSNEFLLQNGFKKPKETKTGTTIVGIIFKDGVVLGADTRATGGNIVADKNCEKIHFLAENM